MENEDKQKKPSALQLVKAWSDKTSMHGMIGVFNSTSLWKIVVWSLLTACGIGFALYQLVDVLQDYYTYPVTTLVSLKHDNSIQFPAITICNMNAVKRSSVPNETQDEILRLQKNSANCDKCEDKPQKVYNIMRFAKDDQYFDYHYIDDMLISCVYNRKMCTNDSFNDFLDGVFGHCYTFDVKKNPKAKSPNYGPQNGLILEMSIEYSEYISLTSQAGLKVIVHEHDEKPFPDDGGILVQPGLATSIAITKTVTRRLPPPYGDCFTATGDRSSYLSLYDQEGFSYTENACRKSCYQLSLVKNCECCDSDLPCDKKKIIKILKLKDISRLSYCESSENETDCFSTLENTFLSGNLPCLAKCSPACSQTTFDKVVSTAAWPSDPYLDVLLYKAEISVLNNKVFQSTDEFKKYASENFLRLEIFYESLDFLEITTKAKFGWTDILGVIGGFLGLWLGFSILTAFEIIELVIDIFPLWRRKTGNNNVRNFNENH